MEDLDICIDRYLKAGNKLDEQLKIFKEKFKECPVQKLKKFLKSRES